MACPGTPQQDDHRGFLQAGDHNEASMNQIHPSTSQKSRWFRSNTTSSRRWSSVEQTLSVQDYIPPLTEITPGELDLESTLVEQMPRSSVTNGEVVLSNSSEYLGSSNGRSYTVTRSPQRSSTFTVSIYELLDFRFSSALSVYPMVEHQGRGG